MAIERPKVLKSNGWTLNFRTSAILQGKIPRRRALGLSVSGSLVAVTGLLLVLFRYVTPSQDAFSAYPHPLWSWVIMLHIFATPFFFFFVGSIWWHHAVRHWTHGNHRAAGLTVVCSIVLITLSGYLLYFVGSEFWLQFWRVGHAVLGGIGIVFYALHAIVGFRALARARNETNGAEPNGSP